MVTLVLWFPTEMSLISASRVTLGDIFIELASCPSWALLAPGACPRGGKWRFQAFELGTVSTGSISRA